MGAAAGGRGAPGRRDGRSARRRSRALGVTASAGTAWRRRPRVGPRAQPAASPRPPAGGRRAAVADRDADAPARPRRDPPRPAARPVHRRAGQGARAGARGEDRQHRVRPAADRAAVRRHRVRDPGRGRAHPVHGRLLRARPAGRRPGAQRPAERPRPAAPVRPARVRLVRRDPHLVPFIERAPVADLYALQVGGYYRSTRAGSRRTTCTPSTRQLLARGAGREQGAGHRLPVRRAAGRRKADRVVLGEVPGRGLHLPLVGEGQALAHLDRRRARRGDRGRAARRQHRDHPVHADRDVPVRGVRRPAAVRASRPAPAAPSSCATAGCTPCAGPGPAWTVGTTYTLPDGKRMLFAPGQVWVVLAPDSHASYVNAGKV